MRNRSDPEMRWAAIWNEGWPVLEPSTSLDADSFLAEISLLLEFIVPTARIRKKPLRLWQGASDPDTAIALYLMPNYALRLVHGEADLQTGDDFARPGETITLRYRACARGRKDTLDLRNIDRDVQTVLRAACQQSVCLSQAMPRDLRFLGICHIAAIAPHGVGATDLPGLAAGTEVLTASGPRPVEALRVGDDVVTADGSASPLRWIQRRPYLCLGRRAPIRLRAPYFGLLSDICVTPETRILRTGPSVEYVCGTDAVLVQARDLALNSCARRDQSQPTRMVYHLMLDDHACVMADRCPVETALLADVIKAEDMAPHPHLSDTDKTHFVPSLDRSMAHALASVDASAQRGRR